MNEMSDESLLVLSGREGPFRRTVDEVQIVFHKDQPVSVTDEQLGGLENDLGSALVFCQEVQVGTEEEPKTELVRDWLQTKMYCLDIAADIVDAHKKAKKKGNPRLSAYQQKCYDNRDEIIAESEKPEPETLIDLDELADATGLSIEVVEKLVASDHLPIGKRTRFSVTEINAWLKTKKGKTALDLARSQLEESKEPDDEDSNAGLGEEPEGDDEEVDIANVESLEFSSQAKLAGFYGVEEKTVKEWVKNGLQKDGKVFRSETVYAFLAEKGELGSDVTQDFEIAVENEWYVFEKEGVFQVFTAFGLPFPTEEPITAESIGGLLTDLANAEDEESNDSE